MYIFNCNHDNGQVNKCFTCVRLSEVRTHKPLGPRERVVEVLLGGVVLVDPWRKNHVKNKQQKYKSSLSRPAVVLPDEGEEASPLVLPDSCGPRAGDHHLITVPVTCETLQQVPGAGVINRAELVTVLATDVAPLAIRGPGPTWHHVTSAKYMDIFTLFFLQNTTQ